MKIGEKLKEGRKNKNLTQEEVGEILNVSRSTVSSWEVSRTYPDLEMLVTLSDLYEISLDTMLREDEEMVQSLTKEIQTNRKRKGQQTLSIILFVLVLIFCAYLLMQSDQIISMRHFDISSTRRSNLISVLMISSLVFGLIAWILPIVRLIKPEKIKSHEILSIISLTLCASAISFQVIYHNLLLQAEDVAGLLDTSGAIAVVSILLLLGTILLNSLSYLKTSIN